MMGVKAFHPAAAIITGIEGGHVIRRAAGSKRPVTRSNLQHNFVWNWRFLTYAEICDRTPHHGCLVPCFRFASTNICQNRSVSGRL
jgi:hypothetical protein